MLAEDAGWDGVFLADHIVFPPPAEIGAPSTNVEHWDFPDPWIVLAAIASRTGRIKLGTWVTPIPRRQPWQVARDLATLDQISGGRVILGVGLGRRPDYELFGAEWDLRTLGEKADEALHIIDRLWSGDRLTFAGRHFQVQDVAVLPVPRQTPRIPIVVGGLWPGRSFLRRGAQWDGIMPHFPGDGVLPPDASSPEEHVTAMLSAYDELTAAPGEVFLPLRPPASGPRYRALCLDLGATWFYVAKHEGEWSLDLDMIRGGPAGLLDR